MSVPFDGLPSVTVRVKFQSPGEVEVVKTGLAVSAPVRVYAPAGWASRVQM